MAQLQPSYEHENINRVGFDITITVLLNKHKTLPTNICLVQ